MITPTLPPSALGSRCAAESAVDALRGELLGVEVLARGQTQPFEHVGVFLGVRIGQCGLQVLVPPGTAAVLWWARALAGCAHRAGHRGAGREDLLQGDVVLPVVAEVVGVADLVADPGE